jgi:hypothetical protein
MATYTHNRSTIAQGSKFTLNSFEFERIRRCNGVPGSGCLLQFGSYKDGMQNTKAMGSGERRVNVTNETQTFQP